MRAQRLLILPFLLIACAPADGEEEQAEGIFAQGNSEDAEAEIANDEPGLVESTPDALSDAYDDMTRERVAAARKEARELAGGRIIAAPEAGEGLSETIVAAAQALRQDRDGADCRAGSDYAEDWAERLPEPFTVYPRARVTAAAGSEGGCNLRVARFTSAVPTREIVDYYFTRARSDGFSADVREIDGRTVVGGKRARAAYLIYVGPGEDGRTRVELLARGG